jgi:heat shock protein HtpX
MRMNNYVDNSRWAEQKLKNGLHTVILLTGMMLLSSLMGWFFAGTTGMVWVLVATTTSVILSPRLMPRWIRRRFGGRTLEPWQALPLHNNLRELTRRAGLPVVPTLMYLPTRDLSALTTGSRGDAVIALSDGLLRSLNNRELTAVMAHEISHLKNNDLWIMNVSATFNQVTSILSTIGQVLLFLNLPLILLSEHHFPWIGILLLIFAPSLAMLLQLALSRTREFNADLGAAMLTGDPRGLASALFKIEQHRRSWLGRLRWMGHGSAYDSIWRTHPPTRERINRLIDVSPKTPLFQTRANQSHYRLLGTPFFQIRNVNLVG